MFEVFEEKESQVRSYCRHFPVLLEKAINAELFTADGKRYLDFLAGAGAINYGHNNPYIKNAIVNYLSEDNILHALDLFTVAKQDFLKAFDEIILKPKGLDYKIMCCGATGTNAVEAALKLARKNTKRQHVIAFHGAFHGMTTGALACTGERFAREGAGVALNNVTFVPYSHQLGGWEESLAYLNYLLSDDHSGVPMPAAIILETVQAEGGINVAEVEWLKGIRDICDKYGIMMIVDDIQVGNCRSGSFFSFERAGIVPDLVTLSKSISGLGMPMSLLLMRPQFDIFGPAEHNGTWRGNQLAFVGAKAGFEYYRDHQMEKMVAEKESIIRDFMKKEIAPIDERLKIRGIGMIWGIDFAAIDSNLSKAAMHACLDRGMIIERAGSFDCVLKLLPPLTIPVEQLREGLEIIRDSVKQVLDKC
ncbi:MAG: diaminobutyrate--2-oxoglutarate transaminase [Prevotella sp.]|nr:diaminobutyrate--2-oxoglutarate transaminase [Prevotella sp.]